MENICNVHGQQGCQQGCHGLAYGWRRGGGV
jgi:hypothetical protein